MEDSHVERLVEMLGAGTPAASDEAARALRELGRLAVPALLRGLRHPDHVRRMRCASVLRTMGPALQAAVSDYVALLTQPDPQVREEAAWALGLLGWCARSAVPPLSAALEDPDPAVRAAAEASLKVLRAYFTGRAGTQLAAESGPVH